MGNVWNNTDLIKTLKNGGIVVMPTDTIYGVVGSAENKSTVERIYKVRNRPLEKRCIVLIGDLDELKKLDIVLNEEEKETLKEYWLNDFDLEIKKIRPTSVELRFTNKNFTYLHLDNGFLAFRLPQSLELRNLLKQTGPLIAPSANLSGLPPAKTIQEAKSYFADGVDLYVDGGYIEGNASKIIRLNQDGSIVVIRE